MRVWGSKDKLLGAHSSIHVEIRKARIAKSGCIVASASLRIVGSPEFQHRYLGIGTTHWVFGGGDQ